MFSVDLDKSLSCGLSKAQLLSQFEAAVDSAIARSIEAEAARREIENRRKRIAEAIYDGVGYTSDDLIFLQRLLNDEKKGTCTAATPGLEAEAVTVKRADGKSVTGFTNASAPKKATTTTNTARTIEQKEFEKILDSLLGSIADHSAPGKRPFSF